MIAIENDLNIPDDYIHYYNTIKLKDLKQKMSVN